MNRLILILLLVLSVSTAAVADPAPVATPTAAALGAECYAKVGPLLHASGGKLTPAVRNAYLAWAEASVIEQLHQSRQTVPSDCLADVLQDETVRDAVFGSVFPPDASILQNYARLRTQLGPEFLARYKSLVIAAALARRIKGVEQGSNIQAVGQDYQPGFWTDESLQVPGSDEDRAFARHLADFMTQRHVAAADLYRDDNLQIQCKARLVKDGVSSDLVNQVSHSVGFGERLKYALVLMGQRPSARDPKPDPVAWLRHLAQINEAVPPSTLTVDGKPLVWPLFPVDTAPWPLLLPLAHPVPLREADYIWEAFEGEHGSDRFHTYGPYRGDEDAMPDSLKPSPWFWDAWPDRIVHGGACVNISKGTVDLFTALDEPAMWAGQPGHANLITYEHGNGVWTTDIQQAFAGGADVTYAQWYVDDDPDAMRHHRDLYDWPGAEYQLGLSLAMNVGLTPYMDTRIASNIFRIMPAKDKPQIGNVLLRSALQINPFNPELWYCLGDITGDGAQGVALVGAARQGNPSLLSNSPGGPYPIPSGASGTAGQYWSTVAEYEAQFAILSRPAPSTERAMKRVYDLFKNTPGVSLDDRTTYADTFGANSPSDLGPDAVQYDLDLANAGDPFGSLRMGERYRDGDGVAQNEKRAQIFFGDATQHGDAVSSMLLTRLNPSIPASLITVSASSVYSPDQIPLHLIDGTGMTGVLHDNSGAAYTMWQSVEHPAVQMPAPGLAPSPAWVRFDFARPLKFNAILIWNHNQADLTDRGFRGTRIYGTSDGTTWIPLTAQGAIEIPRASGKPSILPISVPNVAAQQSLTSVIIAADAGAGNYGSACYGLSAVRFLVPPLPDVLPEKRIAVTASSIYSRDQIPQHLIDGSGMTGLFHDNAGAAQTMWHTVGSPSAQPPAPGLAPSPAWVKFDFTRPMAFESILIWNHNQANLTDRGFHKTRIYGTTDGKTWYALTSDAVIELPRASGDALAEPSEVKNHHPSEMLTSIIIAAEKTDGNFGSDCYGLSAVRFVAGR